MFSREEIKYMQSFIDKHITKTNSMTSKDIYKSVKKDLDLFNAQQFRVALSKAVNNGQITGIVGKRKVGYIREANEPASTQPKEEPPKRSKPLQPPKRRIPQYYHHVWVEQRLYRVPRTFQDIFDLLIILGGMESEGGNVVFNGKQYECPDHLTFEKILCRFLHGLFQKECDPILNDNMDIPVELRIAEAS